MTSQRDPFGPPPTEPPTIGDGPALQAPAISPRPKRPRSDADRLRATLIWSGAITTIGFAGATGLLLESPWAYLTLGATFASLLLVVVAVSTPTRISP